MKSSLGQVGAGGGTSDATTRWRSTTAADLGGAGHVLVENRGVVVRGLFQLKKWQRGECEGGR